MAEYKIAGIDALRVAMPELIKEIVERQYLLQPEFHRYGDKGLLHSLEDAKYNLEYLLSSV